MPFNLNTPPDLTLHPINQVVLVPNANSGPIPGVKGEFTVSQQDTLRSNVGQPPGILAAAVAAVENSPSANSSACAVAPISGNSNNNNNNNNSSNSGNDGNNVGRGDMNDIGILHSASGSSDPNDNINSNNGDNNQTSANTSSNITSRGSISTGSRTGANIPGIVSSRPTSNEFVRKLFKILESNAYPNIIRWSRDGESFVVLDTGSFTTQILPNHFKHSNFASFVRQLNKYDFHKIKRKPNKNTIGVNRELSWEFKHPYFRIHDEASLDMIKRKLTSSKKQQESTDSSEASLPGPHINIGSLVKEESLKYCVSKESFNAMKKRVDKLERDLEISRNETYQSKVEINKLASKYNTLLESLITFRTTSENLIGNLNTLCTSLINQGIKLPPNLSSNDVSALPPMEKFNTIDTILVNDINVMKDGPNNSLTNNLDGSVDETNNKGGGRPSIGRTKSNNGRANTNTNASANLPPFDPNSAARNSLAGDSGMKLGAGVSTTGVPQNPDVGLNSTNNLVPPLVQPLQGGLTLIEQPSQNLLPNPTANPQTAISTRSDSAIDLRIVQNPIDALNSAAPSQQNNGIAEQPQTNTELRKGFHVLLVEDDVVSIQLCSKFLKRYGCTVQVVTDGLSAISTLKKFRYDLVLMDIVMPSIDGASATFIIRKFDNETPIIAMTGNIKDQDLIRYLQYGMNDILAKPFTRNDLHSMLLRYLKDKIPLHEQQQNPSPPMLIQPQQQQQSQTQTQPQFNPQVQ